MWCKRLFNAVLISAFILSCQTVFAQDSTKAVKGPKIKLAEATYDFGTIAQGAAVKHIFKFKNVGTDTLKIEQVRSSCGCTAAESSKIIPPQKDGQIEVNFNTASQMGKVSKTVYIFSNDVEVPQRSVSIHGTVEAGKTAAPQN
jgi:hypothetical protein